MQLRPVQLTSVCECGFIGMYKTITILRKTALTSCGNQVSQLPHQRISSQPSNWFVTGESLRKFRGRHSFQLVISPSNQRYQSIGQDSNLHWLSHNPLNLERT